MDTTHQHSEPERSADERSAIPVERSSAVRSTELIISYVLRGGVLLSAGIILVGVIAYYVRYGTDAARIAAERGFPRSVGEVLGGVAHAEPVAVVSLGLLILLATPVVRVLISILAFGVERDWRYVVITTIVLVILLVSFFLGKAGA